MELNSLKRITWSEQLEAYFKTTGEKAYGYGLLHKQCEKLYTFRTTIIDLPVIILSTICGTLSIGNASLFGTENEKVASMAIGGLSLCVGVINTIGSYFSWAKRAEAHKISSIEYQKLFRFLSVELSLPRDERMACKDLLKTVRETYERLQEIAPLIPQKVLIEFRKKYKKYSNIAKPSEINGLESIMIHPLFDGINNELNKHNKNDLKYNSLTTHSTLNTSHDVITPPNTFTPPNTSLKISIPPDTYTPPNTYLNTSPNTYLGVTTPPTKKTNQVVADILKKTIDNVVLEIVPSSNKPDNTPSTPSTPSKS